MKYFPRYLLPLLGISLILVSCSRKVESPPTLKEGYVGHWKLNDPQGNTYYMTLDADGSGKTTRGGGEFGKWEFKQDHIEANWFPKNLKIYFDPGSTKPLLKDSAGPQGAEKLSIGTKVEKIPDLN